MSNRLKRGLVSRIAVGFVVLAFPLLATGAAQASLAGALPASTTTLPDLVSATIDPAAKNVIDVCFDKTLNSLGAAANFDLGGYRANNLLRATTATIDPTHTNCAFAFFPTAGIGATGTVGTKDENQYSFVEVTGAAVVTNVGSVSHVNLVDSVSLTGSTTHSGTTGVTTTPNLVGVLAPIGLNQTTDTLTYVFDKTTHVDTATGFFYETSAGVLCNSTAVATGDHSTTITIAFAGGVGCGTSNVVQAVRAGALGGTVEPDYDPATANGFQSGGGIKNPPEAAVLPNCTSPCATQHPDLVSAALGTNQDQIVYTFDHNVVVNGTGVGTFIAELADGETVTSSGAVATGGTTVTANFGGNLSTNVEFAVGAFVNTGAVGDADSTTTLNLPGFANVGDNAGAFGGGFTTGPEVFGIQINRTTGAVTVNLDDRTSFAVRTNLINLWTTSGSQVTPTTTPAATFNSSAGPGPQTVSVQYAPTDLTNVTQLQFLTGAFEEPGLATGPSENVPQIVSAPSSAAILRAYHAEKARTHHAKRHKRHKK